MSIENINYNTLVFHSILGSMMCILLMLSLISCHKQPHEPEVILLPLPEYTILSVNEFLDYKGQTIFVVTTLEAGDLYTSWSYVSLGNNYVAPHWYSSIIAAKKNIGNVCKFTMRGGGTYSRTAESIFVKIECLDEEKYELEL